MMKVFALLLSVGMLGTALPIGDAVANGVSHSVQLSQQAPAGGTSGEGKKVFTSGTTPTCGTCHALRDADATGNIGPDLDALKPDSGRVKNAVQNGFENMPAFGHVLSAAQVDALARYVEQAAGAAK